MPPRHSRPIWLPVMPRLRRPLWRPSAGPAAGSAAVAVTASPEPTVTRAIGRPLQHQRAHATSGSDGWLATAGVGCDYQFSGRWVVGAFADGTWSDIKGDHAWRVFGPGETFVGENKMDWSWAAGGRIGYLVNPSFLTYFNAGYTQAHTEAYNLRVIVIGAQSGLQVPGRTFDGFFVGSGSNISSTSCPVCSSRAKVAPPGTIAGLASHLRICWHGACAGTRSAPTRTATSTRRR